MTLRLSFTEYIEALNKILLYTMVSTPSDSIDVEDGFVSYMGHLIEASNNGKRVFFIGNGGSAGICTHSANDYAKNGGVRSMSLHDGAVLTCLGNDFGFEQVFVKQLEYQAQKGDVLIAISSSGQSADICSAVVQAKEMGLWVCTFSGFSAENPLRTLGDLNWYVDSMEYGFVELAHQVLIHCALDRKDLLWERWLE
jgi:D-sedoheptulose 7-phosphate isomerase